MTITLKVQLKKMFDFAQNLQNQKLLTAELFHCIDPLYEDENYREYRTELK